MAIRSIFHKYAQLFIWFGEKLQFSSSVLTLVYVFSRVCVFLFV